MKVRPPILVRRIPCAMPDMAGQASTSCAFTRAA